MYLRRQIRGLTILLLLLIGPGRATLQSTDSEDELKAAAVWLFVQYSHLSPGSNGAITVGVVGRPSFEQTLGRTLHGKSTQGHPVQVVAAKGDARCCQMLYLATDKSEEIRRFLQGARVLTMGESDHFLDQGGAVNLFIADGHISFEASLEALERCGVNISSNLLKFGQIRDRRKVQARK